MTHHTLTVLLHYLVKYRYSKMTIIRINTSQNVPLKQFFTNLRTEIELCSAFNTWPAFLTQCNIIQIFPCDLSLKCLAHLPMWLLLIASFCYICILQDSVATQLRCGGIFNNYSVVNCPESVLVKEFWKSVNILWRYRNNRVWRFFSETQCIVAKWWVIGSRLLLITDRAFSDEMKIIDLWWPWRSVCAVVAKWYIVSQKQWETGAKVAIYH